MDSERLGREFEQAMRASCAESAGLGYYPTRFLMVLDERDAVRYAKQLVRSGDLQSGLRRLAAMKRLNLSIEHLVANEERFRPLFTDDDRDAARWRLEQAAGRR